MMLHFQEIFDIKLTRQEQVSEKSRFLYISEMDRLS